MIKTLAGILLVLSLQGCAFLDYFRDKEPPSVPPGVTLNISAEALRECNLLNDNVIVITFEDAITAYGVLATEYGTCASKQKLSVKLIKQLGNIE